MRRRRNTEKEKDEYIWRRKIYCLIDTWWYWVNREWYWLIYDGTGSVEDGTGRYLVLLGQKKAILVDT